MSTGTRVLLIHAAVVVVLLILLVGLEVASSPDAGANIGAGLVALPLMALGMPWSLAGLIDPYAFGHWSDEARYGVWFGPAIFNVALHAGVAALRRRRRP